MLETNTLSQLHLFYPLLFIFAIIATFVLSRVYNDKLNYKKDIHFKDKDVEVVSEAFNKIGQVSKNATPDQVILNLQNIENNKEIHTNNEKIEKLEETIEFLQNDNGKLRADLSILKSRFYAFTKAIGRE